MTINQIVSEGIKELCGARGDVSKIRHTSQAELVNAYDRWDKQEAFIHSYTRKLIESLAEEILGEDDEKEVFWKEGCHDVEVECDNSSRNLLRAEQRLKVKEIITNLK